MTVPVPFSLALVCALAALGAKVWVIRLYGSPVPFWDQWAEATVLYQPYLSGSLNILDWFGFHNEHRIFFSRVTAFMLFLALGRWDPIVQMLFNAALHAAVLGWLAFVLARNLSETAASGFAVLTAFLVAVPFGWENTLWGFQAQFYFLMLLSALCLTFSFDAPAFSGRWLIGLSFGLLSYLAMASGAVTLLAVAAIALAQLPGGRRRCAREYLGIIVQIALPIAMIVDAARQTSSAGGTFGDLLVSVALTAAWPVTAAPLPTVVGLLSALVLQAPLFLLLGRLLAARTPMQDPHWLYVALGGWVLLQVCVIAFGRPQTGPVLSSRYLDILVLGVIVNAGCLFSLLDRPGASARPTVAGLVLWLAAVGLGSAKAANGLGGDLNWRQSTAAVQMENLREFLATNDFDRLKTAGHFGLPFPAAEPLRQVLTDPKIRNILPSELLGPPLPRALAVTKRTLLSLGPSLLAIAVALFVLAQVWLRARPVTAKDT